MSYRLSKLLLCFGFFLISEGQLFSQTIRKASQHLAYFENPTSELTSQILNLQSVYILEPKPAVVLELKQEILRQIQKRKIRFEQKEPFNGLENPKQAYLQWLETTEVILKNQSSIQGIFMVGADSLALSSSQQEMENVLVQFIKAASKLDAEIQNFSMLNKLSVKKEKDCYRTIYFNALVAIQFGFQIHNPVVEARTAERLFFSILMEDTGSLAAGARAVLLAKCESGTVKLKATPPFPEDGKLKSEGLNSLRLYRLEAVYDLSRLLIFREKEIQFVRQHQKMKKTPNPDEQEMNRYRLAVKVYNEYLRETNELVKNLVIQRQIHEQKFDYSFREFIQNQLIGK